MSEIRNKTTASFFFLWLLFVILNEFMICGCFLFNYGWVKCKKGSNFSFHFMFLLQTEANNFPNIIWQFGAASMLCFLQILQQCLTLLLFCCITSCFKMKSYVWFFPDFSFPAIAVLSDPDIRGGYIPEKCRECWGIVSMGKREIGSGRFMIHEGKSKIPQIHPQKYKKKNYEYTTHKAANVEAGHILFTVNVGLRQYFELPWMLN